MGKDKRTFKEIESNMRKVQAVRIEWLNCCKIVSVMHEHFRKLENLCSEFCEKPRVGLSCGYQPFISFVSKEDEERYTVYSAVQFFDMLREIKAFEELKPGER